jgi:hypothetical protein
MTKRALVLILVAVAIGLPVAGMVSRKASDVTLSRDGSTVTMMAPASLSNDAAVMQYEGRAGGAEPMMAKVSPASIMPEPGMGGFRASDDRTIIKNASLQLVVEDARATVSKVTELVMARQGLVINSNVYETGGTSSELNANLTVRVPADQLDSFLADIRALPLKVSQESISADDQTELRVDLESQLANLRATETQLRTILQRATTVEDTLKVQTELSSIRGQIERMDAQLANLQGAAAMARVDFTIVTKASQLNVGERQLTFLEEIQFAFKQTLVLYREMFIAGLKLAIYALPAALIGGIIYLILRQWRK